MFGWAAFSADPPVAASRLGQLLVAAGPLVFLPGQFRSPVVFAPTCRRSVAQASPSAT
ncbi:hypothetical protein JWS13_00220 (plasmid) [Rhodococcus pseudokoreensis]|uniref:Uncharacterized protein n=1 Tax=Rhodococcus pseudokoreensis TaxID=2811421 RepID=A0A974VXV2_9NOCA|nr:hypothetical protein [Rhodococcus pseudokoreensis]QSE87172.1 hypothetical protein JWS13_00220 [Rhodococcus pseudokoreensis]